jgi:hypothetical protein
VIPVLENIEKKEAARMGLQFIETLDELKLFYSKIISEYKNKEYRIIGSGTTWENLVNIFISKIPRILYQR